MRTAIKEVKPGFLSWPKHAEGRYQEALKYYNAQTEFESPLSFLVNLPEGHPLLSCDDPYVNKQAFAALVQNDLITWAQYEIARLNPPTYEIKENTTIET